MLPEGLEEISFYAFYCSGIKNLILPLSLNELHSMGLDVREITTPNFLILCEDYVYRPTQRVTYKIITFKQGYKWNYIPHPQFAIDDTPEDIIIID